MADVVHDEGDAGDGGGGGPSLVVASVDKMQNYLKRVVPVLIEPEPDLADADTSAGGVGGGAEGSKAMLSFLLRPGERAVPTITGIFDTLSFRNLPGQQFLAPLVVAR